MRLRTDGRTSFADLSERRCGNEGLPRGTVRQGIPAQVSVHGAYIGFMSRSLAAVLFVKRS